MVIQCMDYRFVTEQRNFLVDKGYQNSYDLLVVAGASKNLEQIKDQIALSKKLHDPDEILIFDHEDCGGYGADNSFETHKENLLRAKSLLESAYPNTKIKLFFSKFEKIEEIS